MATIADELLARWPQTQPRIDESVCVSAERDVAHIGEDQMPPRRTTGEMESLDEAQERREFRDGIAAMIAVMNRKPTFGERMERLGPFMLTILVLGVTTVRFDSGRENATASNYAELKNSIENVRRDASEAAKEAHKANNNYALLDVYNRELERALIRKGITLPTYPALEK